MARWPKLNEADEIDAVKATEVLVRAQLRTVGGTILPEDEAVPVGSMVNELIDGGVPRTTAYRHVSLMKGEPWVLTVNGARMTMVSSGWNFSKTIVPERDREDRGSRRDEFAAYGAFGGRPPRART